MTNEQASKIIMAEASLAITAGDYLTLERLYARLSTRPLDLAIAEVVANAILNASDSELAFAARFAVRSAEIREETEARMA